MQLTLDEFAARYGVIHAPTTLPTPEQCDSLQAAGRLWAAVDGELGHYLLRGIHGVNAWAYWITERPVPEAVTEVVF